jgi:hypothetical protein
LVALVSVDLLEVGAAAVEQRVGVLVGIEERSLDAIDVGLISLERFCDRLPKMRALWFLLRGAAWT